jgi:hypothetical protein
MGVVGNAGAMRGRRCGDWSRRRANAGRCGGRSRSRRSAMRDALARPGGTRPPESRRRRRNGTTVPCSFVDRPCHKLGLSDDRSDGGNRRGSWARDNALSDLSRLGYGLWRSQADGGLAKLIGGPSKRAFSRNRHRPDSTVVFRQRIGGEAGPAAFGGGLVGFLVGVGAGAAIGRLPDRLESPPWRIT